MNKRPAPTPNVMNRASSRNAPLTESAAMTLSPLASHPSSRSYVLKLHRDAKPQIGHLFGRLESMSSGRCFAFANAEELLRCLVLDAR
jgi:hypothetical protein